MGPRRPPPLAALLAALLAGGCGPSDTYHSFADYPGFSEYYADRCPEGAADPSPPALPGESDGELLRRFRPRLVLPPGGNPPVDFYRDYLPCTVLRRWPGGEVEEREVTPGILQRHRADRGAYLDYLPGPGCDARPRGRPVVYGRVYRERVSFPDGGGGERSFDLTFLKYNPVFAVSGLAADLPPLHRMILLLPGLDPGDWHELDNFVAVHVVLDGELRPLAVILAQHNHHRAYLLGRDMALPPDGRLSFDVALRSNEIYPSSGGAAPRRHRVVPWSLYLEYLLGGGKAPFFHGHDVTLGRGAGGREVDYDLETLSPCDPLYTAEILLGEPRPFLGRWYIGRDGPPGSDYYEVPALLPLGNLLKFGYLRDGDAGDLRAVRDAVDVGRKSVDVASLVRHGGRRFYEEWTSLPGGPAP